MNLPTTGGSSCDELKDCLRCNAWLLWRRLVVGVVEVVVVLVVVVAVVLVVPAPVVEEVAE